MPPSDLLRVHVFTSLLDITLIDKNGQKEIVYGGAE